MMAKYLEVKLLGAGPHEHHAHCEGADWHETAIEELLRNSKFDKWELVRDLKHDVERNKSQR
jgi:hypothetical protein